jgi:hypothetical protein
VPVVVGARPHEELDLHLLELAHPEDEVTRGDLVAKGLADLGDAEGQLPGGRVKDVLEVDEDTLRRLGPQVGVGTLVGHRPDIGLEHHVEGAGLGQVGRAAPFAAAVLDVVGPPAALAAAAVDHGVGKGGLVPRVAQDQPVGEDRAVQALYVVALVDVGAPPGRLQVVLELHAQRAVIVGPLQAAVKIGARKDKAAALAERNEFFHACSRHRVLPWQKQTPDGRMPSGDEYVIRGSTPLPRFLEALANV